MLKLSSNFLTISIPTYNRSIKLAAMLNDILFCVKNSFYKNNIKILVSDNGSDDNTLDILNYFKISFNELDIDFEYYSENKNRGFDFNVFKCYENSNSDFVWFISDDDKLYKNNFDKIIETVFANESNIYYFNFSQSNVNELNPYIKSNIIFQYNDENCIDAIAKIFYYPKLSSIIVKKIDINTFLNSNKYLNFGFMHLYIILEIFKSKGTITFSKIFIATTSNDFLDSIRFPPYITNYYLDFIRLYTYENNIQNLYYKFSHGYEKCDPLATNLLYLGSYYRGNFIIDKKLYEQLKIEIDNDFKNYKLNRSNHSEVILALFKYLVSLIYFNFKKQFNIFK
jgi:glycosyltransferase involved in cell wall biosynthesis